MHILNPASLLFLAYILLFLPWITLHSLRKNRVSLNSVKQPIQSWASIWAWNLIQHAILILLAWLAIRSLSYKIFVLPELEFVHVLYALISLLVCLGLGFLSQLLDSKKDQKSNSAITFIVQNNRRQKYAKLITILAASVAEEIAYRGAGFVLIWNLSGNPWVAAFVCSITFAIVHGGQGWKNVIIIFAIALVFQALVFSTNTLVFAIIVHALFDLFAFYKINREQVVCADNAATIQ